MMQSYFIRLIGVRYRSLPWEIGLKGFLWLLLWCYALGEDVPLSKRYYDVRERVATRLTLEWTAVKLVSLPPEFIQNLNKALLSQAAAVGAPLDKVKLVDESLANQPFELSASYTIARTPQRMRVTIWEQVLIPQEATTSEFTRSDVYIQGSTMAHVWFGSNSQPRSVHLAKTERDVLGMGSFTGTLSAELLIFLAGISPMRLRGIPLDQWRLKSLSPEEWVFVLACEKSEKETSREPEIEIRLDRQYHDAPARLDIREADGTVRTWRTLKYKRIDGVWFPSEVEYIVLGSQKVQIRYILTRITRTRSVDIEIPIGTPVYDWRRMDDTAWHQMGDYEETTWKPDLLDEKKP